MKTVGAILLTILAFNFGLFAGQHHHPKGHHRVVAKRHHRQKLYRKVGEASWYGCDHDTQLCPWGDDGTQGQPTSSGRRFDTHKAMCASWYYPLHSWVIIKNKHTHKSTACQILDRGPNLWTHRVIDLSQKVKNTIGMRGNEGVVVYSKIKPQLVADAF